MIDELFVTAADIKPLDIPKDHWMACPKCGEMAKPYGGFGGGPNWSEVGKYRHCVGWYANPWTGVFYDRGPRGLRAVPMAKALRP
jgi:hypothetical protein